MKKLILFMMSILLITGCINKPITYKNKANHLKNETAYLYYYNLLSKKEKQIYRDIYNCVYEHGERITLKTTDDDLIDKISKYVLYDNPEFFYFDSYTMYFNDDTTDMITYYTYSKKEIKKYQKQLDKVYTEFINTLPDDLNTFEQLGYIYKFVIDKCEYVENAKDDQEITSSLLFNKTVCSGYAKAVQYLCDKLEIDCTYIGGKQKDDPAGDIIGHAWNMVCLDNDYYYIDATWGDNVEENAVFAMNSYFMFDSTDMLKLYEPDDRIYEKTTTGQNTYFNHEGYYSETYDKTVLSKMVKKYRNNNAEWMEFKFSDNCYKEAKNKLIDQDEMFYLFNPYYSGEYSVNYITLDELNIIIFNLTN